MTGDQQWPTYEPRPGAPESDGSGGPGAAGRSGVPRGPKVPVVQAPRPPRRRSAAEAARLRTRLIGTAVVVVVGAVAVPLVIAAVADGDGVPGLGAPDAQSAEGLEQLRDDIEERTGGTEVFRAVIYPEYASVDLPVDATSQREESMSWRGDLESFGGKGTASNGRVDLADVDADVMAAAIAEAKGIVDEPTSWYVIVEGPSTTPGVDDPASISAYASNEYSESAYVEVALDGTEIRRYDSTGS